MREQLTAAISGHQVVTFTYQGHQRRVQPAALGIGGRKGRLTLHGYQVGGSSERGGLPHWRNFDAGLISDLAVLEESFATPPGYAKPWMNEILVALPGSGAASTSASGRSDGSSAGQPAIGGLPLNAETAAKAAEVAEKAFGAIGKWLRKKG